jgi:hypothetical protein
MCKTNRRNKVLTSATIWTPRWCAICTVIGGTEKVQVQRERRQEVNAETSGGTKCVYKCTHTSVETTPRVRKWGERASVYQPARALNREDDQQPSDHCLFHRDRLLLRTRLRPSATRLRPCSWGPKILQYPNWSWPAGTRGTHAHSRALVGDVRELCYEPGKMSLTWKDVFNLERWRKEMAGAEHYM